MRCSIPVNNRVKNIEKEINVFVGKYRLKTLKEEDSNVDVMSDYEELLCDYIMGEDDNGLQVILQDPEPFFQRVTEHYECGATVKFIEYNGKIDELTKQKVYELCWPDNTISRRYGDDFVFDMNEFGYQCFSFNNKIYLCSGIPA